MLAERDLDRRIGPILRDGTPFRELIDLDRREVSLRVMNDQEIHDLEMERIFARSWLVVGHQAEIPNPGDYVLRSMGEDQVIVVRDDDGAINILLNVCAHRGMELCRTDSGNQQQFMCPYHGWLFSTKGNLLGAPIEQQMYGDWDKSDPAYGLLRARVEVMGNGVIFGNFDPNAPSLDDYLGDIKWYFDSTFVDVDPSQLIVRTEFMPRMRWGGNWKVLNDQFWGDSYHGATLHRATKELEGLGTEVKIYNPFSASIRSPEGHVVNTIQQALSHDDTAEMLRSAVNSKRVFPCNGVGGGIGGDVTGLVDAHMLIPRGPADCEMVIVIVTTMEAMAKLFAVAGANRVVGGPVNFAVGEDAMQAPSVQRAAGGVMARKFVTMKYKARYGDDERPAENFPGPAPSWEPAQGSVNVGILKDEAEWTWWLRYFDLMTSDK